MGNSWSSWTLSNFIVWTDVQSAGIMQSNVDFYTIEIKQKVKGAKTLCQWLVPLLANVTAFDMYISAKEQNFKKEWTNEQIMFNSNEHDMTG